MNLSNFVLLFKYNGSLFQSFGAIEENALSPYVTRFVLGSNKNIPESINRRLSNISSNEKIFKKAIPPYQDGPPKSGYDYKLEYKPTINQNNKPKNNRKRNITWFNPLYSKHVASNIGKQFLNLIDTCFPPTNKLHKILNRNTVKLSYRCMPNVKQIISNHNKAILTKDSSREDTTNNCNCRVKEKCPVDNKCQTSSLIYQATVTRHATTRTRHTLD